MSYTPKKRVLAPSFVISAAAAMEGVDMQGLVSPSARSDAGFINRIGRGAHLGGAVKPWRWPVPEVKDAMDLARWAHKKGRLVTEPIDGDLFLLWDERRKRFVRTGIVTEVFERRAPLGAAPFDRCEVVEGGSSIDPRDFVPRVSRYEAEFGELDRFVRWAEPVSVADDYLMSAQGEAA